MKAALKFGALLSAMIAMALAGQTRAATTVTTFDDFTSDALYGSWAALDATIVKGATSYDVSATGYGSNYKYVGFPPITGAGNTFIQLTATLSGPAEADGQLGPIVELIDADGTDVNFAWYGQTLGSHVLKTAVNSPTWVTAAGSVAGLDLNTLTHMHMQLDPGGFGQSGEYTISWQDLSLVVPEPSSIALAGCGLGFLAGVRRRRSR